MGKVIAVSGKGGTGKTTLSAMLIRALVEAGKGPVLAVDADPNSNLGCLLGVEEEISIGMMREEVLENIKNLPPGMTKENFLEMKIQEALTEREGFDLLTMGRPEGPGCYCYVNNILRKYMDVLNVNYGYIVIDNEAGMEHLSRRTTNAVDWLLIVADASMRGIRTAGNIRQLTEELKLSINTLNLIINRSDTDKLSPVSEAEIAKTDLELLGVIPYDRDVMNSDVNGQTVFEIDADNAVYLKLKELMRKAGIL